MSKISCPILGEFEPGSSKAALERKKFEVEAGLDLAEGEQGKAAKAVRQSMMDQAYGSPHDRGAPEFTDQEIREGKDLRLAMFDEVLGVKQAEKKVADEKKLKEKKPEPFGDLKAQLRELEESLKAEGISYTPLREFRQKLETWSNEVSLKEADDFDDEFVTVKKSSERIAEEVRNFKKKK